MGQDRYIDGSVRSFLSKLGSRSPEPAGGSALALAGAAAAALVSLACDAGDPHRRGGEGPLAACRTEAARLSQSMQELIDADVDAYRMVTQALRAIRGAEEGRETPTDDLDAALEAATEVPLRLADAGLETLTTAAEAVDLVTEPVLGDLAAAAHLAEAAVLGSLRNAGINVAAMRRRDYANGAEERIERMTTELTRSRGLVSERLAARSART